MHSITFSEFKSEPEKFLNQVEDQNETFFIKRESNKGVVLLSLDEYNAIIETLYLLGSKKNAKRIFESTEQMKNRQIIQHSLEQ
ncbi:MAG: type II toxin-antitoxin system Phd/YefM family antitoxin [Mongoliitalea sp.]